MVENENHEALAGEAKAGDYSALAGLGDGEFAPDPWALNAARSIGNVVLKALIWILGFLIDIVLGLVKIVAFVFKAIIGLFAGAYLLVRKLIRIWRDVDWPSRLGFVIQGAGNLKAKQWLDGFVFLAMEIAFVLFMVFMGGGYIYDLIILDPSEVTYTIPTTGQTIYVSGSNQVVLMLGVVAILICVAYAIFFVIGFRSMYDTHQILHEPEYAKARNDVSYVIAHYEEFYLEKDGKKIYLKDLRKRQIYKLMVDKYGYPKRSAAYISYVNFRKIETKQAGGFRRAIWKLQDRFYACYKPFYLWLRAHTWATPLERFTEAKRAGKENKAINFETNVYLNEQKAYVAAFSDPELLVDSIYARDPKSQAKGVEAYSYSGIPDLEGAAQRVARSFEIGDSDALSIVKETQKIIAGIPSQGDIKASVAEPFALIAEKHEKKIAKYTHYGETIARYENLATAYRQGDVVYETIAAAGALADLDPKNSAIVNALAEKLGLDEKTAAIVAKEGVNAINASLAKGHGEETIQEDVRGQLLLSASAAAIAAGDYKRRAKELLEDAPIHENKTGREYLLAERKREDTVFHHKFDKYNEYHRHLRDSKALADTFAQGELLYDALFRADPVSKSNGDEPLAIGERLKYREAVQRVVGAFELPLDLAKKVTRIAIQQLKANGAMVGPDEGARTEMAAVYRDLSHSYRQRIEDYIETNRDVPLEQCQGMADAYDDYLKLRPFYDDGERIFTAALTDAYGLTKKQAEQVYDDYKAVIAYTGDDEMASINCLENKAKQMLDYKASLEKMPHKGKVTGGFKRIKEFADEKFAVTVMTLPTLGILIVTVLPLICSIIVGFTNWDGNHTRNIFTWDLSGFSEVFNLFGATSGSYAYTFLKLLGWTLIWAVFATFTNYIAGIILALLINRKTIKGKAIYRTMFVISIAIPQFITLLTINLLLSNTGPINTWLSSTFDFSINFLGDTSNSALIPKITCIVVNMWIGVPYTMLSTSGILMNIPEDLYESSRIDGAGPFRQLVSITMPYVLFVTGPSLITQFVGNINNFNVIYFLIGSRGPNRGTNGLVATASDTDLLINWLYNLCTNNPPEYNIASVIGMAIFAVCAFLSLVVYSRLGSVQNEEAFQ